MRIRTGFLNRGMDNGNRLINHPPMIDDPGDVLVGIDGGATRSKAVAVNLFGQVLTRVTGKSLNHCSAGDEAVRENLEALFSELKSRLPPGHRIAHATIGSAGFFGDATKDEQKAFFGDLKLGFPVTLTGDLVIAFAGASSGQPGLLIVSGTGSIALAENETGDRARAGGWGHLLGDEGSAYWIGRQALKKAIRSVDEGQPIPLVAHLCHFLRARNLSAAMIDLYQHPDPKEAIATLAEQLFGEAGDEPSVLAIGEEAGRALGELGLRTVERLKWQTGTAPLFFSGSVLLRNPLVAETCLSALKKTTPELIRTKPELSPEAGAILISLKQLNKPIEPAFIKEIKNHKDD